LLNLSSDSLVRENTEIVNFVFTALDHECTDVDKNGKLTRDEVIAGVEMVIQLMNFESNSQREVCNLLCCISDAVFTIYDSNGDGRISPEEFIEFSDEILNAGFDVGNAMVEMIQEIFLSDLLNPSIHQFCQSRRNQLPSIPYPFPIQTLVQDIISGLGEDDMEHLTSYLKRVFMNAWIAYDGFEKYESDQTNLEIRALPAWSNVFTQYCRSRYESFLGAFNARSKNYHLDIVACTEIASEVLSSTLDDLSPAFHQIIGNFLKCIFSDVEQSITSLFPNSNVEVEEKDLLDILICGIDGGIGYIKSGGGQSFLQHFLLLLDANDDTNLSRTEISHFAQVLTESWKLNGDHDHKRSIEIIVANFFYMMDVDRDQKLDEPEVLIFARKVLCLVFEASSMIIKWGKFALCAVVPAIVPLLLKLKVQILGVKTEYFSKFDMREILHIQYDYKLSAGDDLEQPISQPEVDKARLEMFIPARYLSGLIPQTLTENYIFWQDTKNCSVIRGYRKCKDLAVYASDWEITITICRDHVPALGQIGVCASIERRKTLMNTNDTLLNIIHSPSVKGCLQSVSSTLCWAENASYLLAWGAKRSNGEVELCKIEFSQLGTSFTLRRQKNSEGLETVRFFSDDRTNLYIADQQPPAKELLAGIPSFIPLYSVDHEWSLWIPNVNILRPILIGRPFDCELLLFPSDMKWQQKRSVSFFSYRMHLSGSTLVPSGFSSALYLLMLRMLDRNYSEVAQLVTAISTDAELTDEAEQILGCLRQTLSDVHPDAHACRVKISLALADCPSGLPWDLVNEAGLYFEKLRHVSASCRISHEDENRLIQTVKSFQQIKKIILTSLERFGREHVRNWISIQTNQQPSSEKGKKDAEGFFDLIQDMVKAKTNFVCQKKRLLSFILEVFDSDESFLRSPQWITIMNRERFLIAEGKGEDNVTFTHHQRKRTNWWQVYSNKLVLERPTKLDEMLYYERRAVIGGRAAVELVLNSWEEPLDLQSGFLLAFELMTGNIQLQFPGMHGHSFGGLLYFVSFEDWKSGSLLASILSVVYHNSSIMNIKNGFPSLQDIRTNKRSPIWRTSTSEDEDQTPLLDLLQQVIVFICKNEDCLSLPQGASPSALPSAQNISSKDKIDIVDICPVLEVRNFSRKECCMISSMNIAVSILLDELPDIKKASIISTLNDYKDHQILDLCVSPYLELERIFLLLKEGGNSSLTELPWKTLESMATTEIEKDMLNRLEKDFVELSRQKSRHQVFELRTLTAENIKTMVQGSVEAISCALSTLADLTHQLEKLKDHDLRLFQGLKGFVTLIANSNLHPQSSADTELVRFKLQQMSGHRPSLSFSFLLQSILSSDSREWQHINYTLTPRCSRAACDLLCLSLLHGIRFSSTNQMLMNIHSLQGRLEELNLSGNKWHNLKREEFALSLQQQVSELIAQIGVKRSYVDPVTRKFLPHFLVFEFQSSIMLRVRQVEIITEILSTLNQSEDSTGCIKQMIMGAGKTCVVSPLLALILPNCQKLCIHVVPPALLEFSRGVLHNVLALGFGKNVRTFIFERKDNIDSSILKNMQNSARIGTVIVTTPSSMKALLLKLVENLFHVTDDGYLNRRQAKLQIVEASRLFSFLRKAIIIMDEVDTILHPLKSELNFPVGQKHSLELSPMRWNFPMFLLDTFLRPDLESSTSGENDRFKSVLEMLLNVINIGARDSSLQRRPHLILLSPNYYQMHMLPLFAKLSLLWCEKQGVNVKRDWIEEYVKEGDDRKLTSFGPEFKKCNRMDRSMLNLVRHWLHLILPHVLQKVNRVTFGLMRADECKKALESNPNTSRARLGLAIPFVGKDTPSESSEFAHPDVVIGLTILAYRYDGLRPDDFLEILRNLHSSLADEIGPKLTRPSSLRFESWVQECNGVIVQSYSTDANIRDHRVKVPCLHNLRISDKAAIGSAFELLRRCRSAINFYLTDFIFPRFMKHQKIKLSASAQELGSDMLFEKRIGFSGTPSSLIPADLGKCEFEPGSEATIFQTLSSSNICGIVFENSSDWTPDSVLDKVLQDNEYKALIDTGALITGFSNLEVAKYLLEKGLRNNGIDGVVYLDELDRKMVLVAATGRSIKIEECGIELNRRFAFYDQIHTTGMDIKHAPNAKALITLGKDMVFRDIAQGAYRMRGIGKGQRLDYLVIPEIQKLIETNSNKLDLQRLEHGRKDLSLMDILVWLLMNSLRSEKLQHTQLVLQNSANFFRKAAFEIMLQGAATLCSSLKRPDFLLSREAFREIISFEIPEDIPKTVTLLEKVSKIKEMFSPLLESHDSALLNIESTLDLEGVNSESKGELDQEMQQEQVLKSPNDVRILL
jgi:hypothetical protein